MTPYGMVLYINDEHFWFRVIRFLSIFNCTEILVINAHETRTILNVMLRLFLQKYGVTSLKPSFFLLSDLCCIPLQDFGQSLG